MVTTSRSRRIWASSATTLAVVIVIAGIAVGCARFPAPSIPRSEATANKEPSPGWPGSAPGQTGEPLTYAGGVATPRSSGAIDPQDAAAQVMEGMSGDPQLAGIITTSSPSGLEVAIELTRNDDGVSDIWLADIAVGAVAELTRSDQMVINDVISSATAVGPGEGRKMITTHLGIGVVRLGQVFGSPDDADLASRVADVATRYDLHVADLRVLHPLETALRVTFVVPNEATPDWTIGELSLALTGATPDVEGLLIELDDADGQQLLQLGAAYRTGEGGLRFAQGQDERFGANHGGYLDLGEDYLR